MLINGQPSELIEASDRGLHYGDGLFETIAVEGGQPMFLSEHFERLQKGCHILGFGIVDKALIIKDIVSLISEHSSGVIKLMLTRQAGQRGFLAPPLAKINRLVSFTVKDSCLSDEPKKVTLGVCETRLSQQPLLAGIKHLSQIERVLARSEWTSSDKQESLMLDTDDRVIEGTMSNLFIVKDKVIKTPSLARCGIEGIMRNFIIRQAERVGMRVEVMDFGLENVFAADEVFLSNSLMPIWSVNQINYQRKAFCYSNNEISYWASQQINTELKVQMEGSN